MGGAGGGGGSDVLELSSGHILRDCTRGNFVRAEIRGQALVNKRMNNYEQSKN